MLFLLLWLVLMLLLRVRENINVRSAFFGGGGLDYFKSSLRFAERVGVRTVVERLCTLRRTRTNYNMTK